jgi:hypothetical protein
LEKSLAHGVSLTVSAIQSDTAHNHKPQVLGSDDFDDFAKLLFASGKAGHFQNDDGVPHVGLCEHAY